MQQDENKLMQINPFWFCLSQHLTIIYKPYFLGLESLRAETSLTLDGNKNNYTYTICNMWHLLVEYVHAFHKICKLNYHYVILVPI